MVIGAPAPIARTHTRPCRSGGGAKERRRHSVANAGFYRAARGGSREAATIPHDCTMRFPSPSPARRVFLGRLAASALALAMAPWARPRRRAGAARGRRLHLRRLWPAGRHRLGRPARGATDRPTAIRYRVVNAFDQRRHDGRRPGAAARAAHRTQAGRRRPRAGRQRRAARRQPRRHARQSRRDGRRAKAPARRCC